MGLVRDTAKRRGAAYGLALAMLFGTIVTFQFPAAIASHGTACLDLDPETFSNPVGTTHTITASLRTPSGAPSTSCTGPGTSSFTATSDTVVGFEFEAGPTVTIVKDDTAPPPRQVTPHNSPSSTADASCTISTGDSSCELQFSSTASGTNRVRGWVQGHPIDENEPRDEASEQLPMTAQGDEPDTTDVVDKTWEAGAATQLNCEPDSATNETGDSHTITCTARDANGNPSPGQNVDAEATGANDPDNANGGTPDFECENTDANGRCELNHQSTQQNRTDEEGTTTYRAWVDHDRDDVQDSGEPSDTVTKTWRHAPLNCTPETDRNPSGEAHTITCFARNTSGQAASGVFIDVEATGANDPDNNGNQTQPDFTCTTGTDGSCSITHGPGGRGRTNNLGTTTYRAWIDEDGNHSGSQDPAQQQHGTYEADAREGQDAGGETDAGIGPSPSPSPTADPGDIAEPDKTDVVTKTWGASRLDCAPEQSTNPASTGHTIQCLATSRGDPSAPMPEAGIEIDVEATGANDPDGGESFTTPDFSCLTTNNGTCTVTHGPGGVGTTDNGGTTIYTAWIDFDRNNTTSEADPNEGVLEGSDPAEPDDTDVVQKTWIASRLDCTPDVDTNPARSPHTVTCSTTDASGAGQAGMNIDVEATGANDPDRAQSFTSPDFSCTTGSNGTCSFIHGTGGRGTTDEFGRTLYRAWIDADNNNATAEADPTEGRDEGTTSPSPSPTATSSPSPTSTTSAGSRSTAQTDGQRAVAQQTSSPSPTPTNGGDQSPSPSPTGGGGASPSPTGTASPGPTPTTSPAPSGPGMRAEPDDTDVVEKNWSAVPTRLTIEPETDTAPVGSCNSFTITATDADGRPVQFVVIDVEQRHERSDNATANDEPTVSFCTPGATDGSNPSAVDPTRGDLGSGEDGTIGGEADNATDSEGKVTIGVRVRPAQGSNGTGNVLVTAFYENEDNDDPDAADPQDSATKTWIPSRARTIDCEPESASNRVGTEHTVTCTVEDANGDPVQGEGVTFTEDGEGEFTTATQHNTDSQGRASATVTSDQTGTQTITGTLTAATEGEPDTDECERPAGDPQGAPAGNCSDSVEKTWRAGNRVQSGPCRNFFQGTSTDRSGGGQVIVGTNGSDVLRGTDERDIICGLGGKDTLIGRGGADRLVGGKGNDILRGNAGGDRISGNRGEDTLAGGSGNDRANGGIDDDVIRGGGGGDTLIGRGGKDVLRGRGGRDTLKGNGGDDSLNGGRGRDTLDGGRGTDTCRSGPGNDRVRRCER